MSQKNKHKNNGHIAVQSTVAFSGPLPHPAILQQYDTIQPGLAERIIKMAELQSEHRRSLESNVINSGIKDSIRGQKYGLTIALFGLSVALVCAFINQPIVGSVIGGLDIVGLVSVFVYGKTKNSNERENRRNQ